MLGADLDDPVRAEGGVARGLGLRQVVGHRLLAVGVLARLHHGLEMRRVLEVRGGDEDRVHVLQGEQVLHVLEGARGATVGRLRARGRRLAVDLPQIADGRHLDVPVLELRGDAGQAGAAAADADVPEGDAIVRAGDAAVGQGRAAEGARADGGAGAREEHPSVDRLGLAHAEAYACG